MGRHCAAVGCKTGYNANEKHNLSLFKVPRCPKRRADWAKKISRKNFVITNTTLVCEKHFEYKFIERHYTCLINGETIKMPRDLPKLTKDAIPTIFPNLPKYFTSKLPKKRTSPSKRKLQRITCKKKTLKAIAENENIDVDSNPTHIILESRLPEQITEPMSELDNPEKSVEPNDLYVTNLVNNVNFLRENSRFIDAVIMCSDGSELPCHQVILASSNCPYFANLLLSNPPSHMQNFPMRIQLPPKLKGYCVETILYFIYTGNVEMPANTNQVKELLATSRFLELDDFNRQMASVLVRSLTVDNYIFVWDLADEYDIPLLRDEVVRYVTKDLPRFFNLPEFLSFDVSRVKLLLASPDVNGHPQGKLLLGVIAWLKRDFATREKEIGPLIKHIKFFTLSKPFLKNVIKTEPLVQESQQLWRAIAATLYSRGVQLENYDPERDNVTKALVEKPVESNGQEEGESPSPFVPPIMIEQSHCNGDMKPKKLMKEMPKLPPKKSAPVNVYNKQKSSTLTPPTFSASSTTTNLPLTNLPLSKPITVKKGSFTKSTVQ